MTKTKTDSNQVFIYQHQDYTVKWRQIQNNKQKWIVIKRPFLVEINDHGNICNKLGVVSKGLKQKSNTLGLSVMQHKLVGHFWWEWPVKQKMFILQGLLHPQAFDGVSRCSQSANSIDVHQET